MPESRHSDPSAARSWHPLGLAGAAALLETAVDGIGSTPYLPGLAAATVGIAAELSAAPYSVPPEVRLSAALTLPACLPRYE